MAKQLNRARVVLLVTGILAVVLVGAVVRYRDELVARYVLRRDFEGLGKNEQGYPEYRHRQTGIVFVGLPGGTFLMGSPKDEKGYRKREGPQHRVVLSSFLIAKHEVTQEQWEELMGSNPSDHKGRDLPVVDISWEDCKEFCERTGLSLPTEAQWEYACRAGTMTRFHPGDDESDLASLGWYGQNSGNRVHAVGEKLANAWGLHDMHGNVFEWCEDFYDPSFYSKEEATRKNPFCASGRGSRVVRGGLYSEGARICRAACRFGYPPSDRSGDTGFRPAWSSP